MRRLLIVCTFILFSSAMCLAQISYKGLTPGKSTKTEAERAFGQPGQVSPTLIEYKSPESWGKFYVQYASDSPDAVVVRMELICSEDSCRGPVRQPLTGVLHDVQAGDSWLSTVPFKQIRYYGEPRYAVTTDIVRADKSFEFRLAFYSKALFESAVPKGGCTGTIFGTWDTNRGRATFTRVGDRGVKGTMSNNNGTVNLTKGPAGYSGEWKDDTGTGTVTIDRRDLSTEGNNAFSGRIDVVSTASAKPAASNNRGRPELGAILSKLMPNWTGTCVP
jgi:hypothetical protein